MSGRVFMVLLVCASAWAQKKDGADLLAGHARLAEGEGQKTRCELCHTVAGWSGARFAHERTGFPLEGAHSAVSCQACHRASFQTPIARLCSGCHRDPHRGEFGARCEGCHGSAEWQATFDSQAHRRTNFPLDGRHALIPCTECHADARDRRFSVPATGCVQCHLDDYTRTSRGGMLDHAAQGLGTQCQDCHQPLRFKPASFPMHDQCFPISSGDHSRIACSGCHRLPPAGAISGSCNTGTVTCSGCHEHRCSKSDEQHREVPGYQCKDRKCYECHSLGGGR